MDAVSSKAPRYRWPAPTGWPKLRPIRLTLTKRVLRCVFATTAIVAVVAGRAEAQAPAHLALIDINEAPIHRLRSLPDIDAARAEGIIKGRPYQRTDDLVTKNIIPPHVFDALKNRIIVRSR